MLKDYTFHENGKITSTVRCDDSEISFYESQGVYLEVFANIDTDYLLDGVATKRLTPSVLVDKYQFAADGIDTVVFSNVPNGHFTAIHSVLGLMVEGDIEESDTFSTTIPGKYHIKIVAFPYLDFETTIEAI